MRHLTLSILVTLTVLLGSAGESFALPECPGSPTKSTKVWTSWNNCEGTATYADGDKYVGELKDGKRHGRGTLYYLADNQFKGDIYVGEEFGDKYVEGVAMVQRRLPTHKTKFAKTHFGRIGS